MLHINGKAYKIREDFSAKNARDLVLASGKKDELLEEILETIALAASQGRKVLSLEMQLWGLSRETRVSFQAKLEKRGFKIYFVNGLIMASWEEENEGKDS